VATPPLGRFVFDAKGTASLPGTLARPEGAPRVAHNRAVNNCYDGMGITLQFLHAVFGHHGLDGRGMAAPATVHYAPDQARALGYNNAFWNGRQLAFGDGDGILFDYFADSLDVVAHEVMHAVMQYTAGLEYLGQAGGLNESVADVFGSMCEQWHFRQTAAAADWLLGRHLFSLGVKGTAMRSMRNPGQAFDDPVLGKDEQIADFKDYKEGMNVHIASGIPNRAFYLVAIQFGGYSWQRAGKIWYATLTDGRIPSDCSFKRWADVTVDHARRMFDMSAVNIVRNAWARVGIQTAGVGAAL